MELISLTPGQPAPDGADWICVDRHDDGRFGVSGCVGGEEAVIVGEGSCDTFDDARLAGFVWAQHRGATRLYILDFSDGLPPADGN